MSWSSRRMQTAETPDIQELALPVRDDSRRRARRASNLPEIIRRHPQVCLVDGLAYDNPPGSRHAERWQDVEEIAASTASA